MSLLLTLALALSAASTDVTCLHQGVATVPRGGQILLDGRIDADEWRDACEVLAAPDYRMLVKQDARYLYVAVVRSSPAVFGVNLYLTSSEPRAPYLDLHASAKIGERVGSRDAWPEWQWWNHHGWSVNVVRFNAFEGERFLPDTAKEFQIALGRLPGRNFLLTLDVERPGETILPVTGGLSYDGMHWLALHLGR